MIENNTITRFDAVVSLNEGKKIFQRGDGKIYIDDIEVTDFTAIDAKRVEMQAEYDANQYQRDRQYPSIGDQLDMQYHDQLDGTTTWKDAIAKVKADNPKGAE